MRLKAIGYIATATICIGVSVTTVTIAKPAQATLSTPLKKETRKSTENPALARNTTAKPETAPTTTTATEQKTEDKEAIGRCWKRLMKMVREVSHAHHTTKK